VLTVSQLHVKVGELNILRGVSLAARPGTLHAVMGPNGSGKSTLAYAIMGHPRYNVVKGDIMLDGESILGLSPEERSLKGIFLGMQEPPSIPGLRLSTFLLAIVNKRRGAEDLTEIRDPSIIKAINKAASKVGLPSDYLYRELNVGFSGGEKKRNELLQALLIDPKVIILDEPDSGMDVDGVKKVAQLVAEFKDQGKSVILITHYARIFSHVEPDEVSVFYKGVVAAKGGPELAYRIEREGYGFLSGE
jgi:Fe-S cluster assembly ATP-binding protein